MSNKISSRQTGPDPSKALFSTGQTDPFSARTIPSKRSGTPPASRIPPQKVHNRGQHARLFLLLALLLLLFLWEPLSGSGIDLHLLLEQFRTLNGRVILQFWLHLADILCSTVLPPLLAILAVGALFRESKNIDLTGEAIHTLLGVLSLCGTVLGGTLRAFVHPPQKAAPEEPEKNALEVTVEEDPLFPDALPEDIRRAMGIRIDNAQEQKAKRRTKA